MKINNPFQRVFRYQPTVAIAAMIIAMAGAARGQQPSSAPAGNAPQGKQDMVTYFCYSCHGYAGQGADTGPRLDTDRWTYANFSAYVRKGGRSMPRYATDKQIPEAALANVYAFLKARPANPDPKNIPLLK